MSGLRRKFSSLSLTDTVSLLHLTDLIIAACLMDPIKFAGSLAWLASFSSALVGLEGL